MRPVVGLLLLILASERVTSAAQRANVADLQRTYAALRAELQLDPDTGPGPRAPRQLRRLWAVVGAWAVAFVRRFPSATAEELVTAIEGLDQDLTGFDDGPACDVGVAPTEFPPAVDTQDRSGPAWMFGMLAEPDTFFDAMARFPLKATAIRITVGREPAFVVTATSAYWGRLMVISRRGVFASKRIHRLGVPHPLPPLADGSARFYVDARSDDWPTSFCRGGQVSIWSWDGTTLRQLLKDGYSDHGLIPGWGIRRGRRGIKVATRLRTKTLSECCACDLTGAVWTIRLTADGVDDRGLRYVTPEVEQIDRLLYRALRGEDASDLATPEAADTLATVLRRFCRFRASYNLDMIGGWSLQRDGDQTVATLRLEGLDFRFRMERRHGRPYVLAMLGPDPAQVAFLAAVRGRLRAQGLCVYCGKVSDRRAAADAVLRDRPELALPDAVVQTLVAKTIPDLCEDVPWPWLLPGEGSSAEPPHRRRT